MGDLPDNQPESRAPFPATDAASPLPEEPAMDIHKPKPVHNLREFLSEIFVIVIGVLIALGLEQAVEAWHWHDEVEAERAALNAEERDGQALFRLRERLQPCIDRRLAEVQLVLQRHRAGSPLGIIGPVGRPNGSGVSLGSWQIALTGQGLAHMPLEEKLDLSSRFSSYQKFNMVIDDEQRVWTKLAVVDNAGLLSDANWSALNDSLSEAKAINNRIRANTPLFLAYAPKRPNDLAPKPEDTAQGVEICRPMLAPAMERRLNETSSRG